MSASRESREFEIILWGATGFTGQLVAQYLSGVTGRETRKSPLTWAIAGRDAKKLAKVKEMIMSDPDVKDEPKVLTADISDPSSIAALTARTRVLISTVGPFSLHGEPVVAACVQTGTDYVDSTGEATWVAKMIAKYSQQAEASGAALVSMCGFDSVPADLGCYLVANELKTKYRTNMKHAQGFTSIKGGGVSGGTIASIVELMNNPDAKAKKASRDAYLLNPPDQRPATKRSVEKDQFLPQYDEVLQRWTSPWLMSIVNTRVARRSLALRRQFDGEGYGASASYNESIPSPSFFAALLQWTFFVVSILLLVLKPTQILLVKFVLPKPGEGPSRASRESTQFNHRVIGTGENGKIVQAVISGGDPGYTDTAKMISESALTLAEDRSKLELNTLVKGKKGANGQVGGFFTPSVACGQILAERLRGAGMGVVVEEYNSTKPAPKVTLPKTKGLQQPISFK